MKYSIYGFIFNSTLRGYDLEGAVDNFISFVGPEGEVVLATITSEDDTRERLRILEEKYSNFKVVESKIDINKTNRWDGQLKTQAMNACSNELRIIADIDERFNAQLRPKWDAWANMLLSNPRVDGFLIPVIDLWGSPDKIRSDRHIGQKFRLHKSSVYARGVPNFADAGGGLINTQLSDTSDPIDFNGNLSNFVSVVNPAYLIPQFADMLESTPHVFHYGFVDLEWRADLGKNFWLEHWSKRSGKEEQVAINKNQLDSAPVIFHNLSLN